MRSLYSGGTLSKEAGNCSLSTGPRHVSLQPGEQKQVQGQFTLKSWDSVPHVFCFINLICYFLIGASLSKEQSFHNHSFPRDTMRVPGIFFLSYLGLVNSCSLSKVTFPGKHFQSFPGSLRLLGSLITKFPSTLCFSLVFLIINVLL